MNCEQAMALLSLELDGMLSETELAALHAHLQVCEDCRTLRAELREAENAFRMAQQEVPEALHTRVMAAVRKEKSAKRKELRRWRYVGAAAAAALALAIFSSVALLQTPTAKSLNSAVSFVGALQKSEVGEPLTASETACALAEQENCPVLVIWTDDTIAELPDTPDEYTEDGAAVYRTSLETVRILSKQTGLHMEFIDPERQYRPDADNTLPAIVMLCPEG